ncbi:MAG TPA: flagellar hook assembly protein FlgD [Gammaproteobacteria bacterium]|nr:flagellar hook assembly protein FlgD [Gammaproteobacteria bacterium]
MTNVDNNLTSALSGLALGEQQTKKKAQDELGQSEFLELMIAQLNNQDPMKPMENGDFIAQMAQFSTVTGLTELQASFDGLAASLQSNQALQASSLVGRTVLVPSGVGTLPQGGTLSGVVDLDSSSSDLTITIQDASGQVIRRLELGPQQTGDVYFNWDGITDSGAQAQAGRYFISAETRTEGGTEALETLVSSAVDSVILGQGGQGIRLNLADGNSVDLSSVRSIQ